MKRAEDELFQNFAERSKQKFCLPITEEIYAIFQQAIAHQQTEKALNLLLGINPNSIINEGEHSGVNSLILLLSIEKVSAEIIKLYEAIINYPEFNLNSKFKLKNFFKKTIFTISAAKGCAWLVTLLLAESRFNPADKGNVAIRCAASNGHTEVVRLLLTVSRVNPGADGNNAIRCAASNGHAEVVRLLLTDSRVNPEADNNYAISEAASYGHTEVVRLLLADARVNPGADGNNAIRWAADGGHTEVVRLLLTDSRVNPGVENNYAISEAASYGHTEVVRLLLADARVNPGVENNYAIRKAASRGHTEVVKLLIESKAVNSTMDYNALGKIALDKKNNNLYATLESYNPANKGFLTVWAGRKDMGSILSILPEETIKEEIMQKIILIKKQLAAKTVS